MTESRAILNKVSLNVEDKWVSLCRQATYNCQSKLETKVDGYVQALIKDPQFNEVREKLSLWEGGPISVRFSSNSFSVYNYSTQEELHFSDIAGISSAIVQKADKAYKKCQAHQRSPHYFHSHNSSIESADTDNEIDENSLDDEPFQAHINSTNGKKFNWNALLEQSKALANALENFKNMEDPSNEVRNAIEQLAQINAALEDPNLTIEVQLELETARQKIIGNLLEAAKRMNNGLEGLIDLLNQQKETYTADDVLAAFEEVLFKAEQNLALNAEFRPQVSLPDKMKMAMRNNLHMLQLKNLKIVQTNGVNSISFESSPLDGRWKNDLQQKILTTKDHAKETAWANYLQNDIAMLKQLNKEIKPLFGKLNNSHTRNHAIQELIRIFQKPENNRWAVALIAADFLLNEEFKNTETYKKPNGIQHKHIVKVGKEVAEIKENLEHLFNWIEIPQLTCLKN